MKRNRTIYCYNWAPKRFGARCNVLLLTLLFCSTALFGQDSLKTITYDTHKQEAKERLQKESLWFRLGHQYYRAPGCSQYSIGPSFISSTKINQVQKHISIRYKSVHKEISFSQWTGNATFNEQDTIENHNRMTVGYFTPLHFFSRGKRELDIKGFLLQPVLGTGYVRSYKAHGIYASPAMQFQFPYGLVEARLNVDYLFGRGIDVLPEVSVQLDALRNLLNPTKVKTGYNEHTSSYVTPLGGGWYEVTSFYSKSDFYLQDIGPLFGVTPRVGIAGAKWATKNYKTYGVGLTGRLSFFGIDVHADRGKSRLGVVKNVNDLNGQVSAHFDNDQVQGFVNTTEFTAEGCFNLAGLFLSIFKKQTIMHMKNTTTPLNRWNFHLGYTYFVPGKVEYQDSETARTYTDKFFTDRPEIDRNAINDPLQHEAGWGVSYGMSYEMGSIGFRINNKLTKTMGSSSTIDIYYILPVRRMAKAYANMD